MKNRKNISIFGKNPEKNKKKPQGKKKLLAMIAVPVVIALIIGITYICGGFEAIDYFLFYRHRSIDPSVVSSGTFPVTFSGGDIITVDNISSKAVVLSKKLLTCVSYKGRVLYTESFTFVDPVMKTDGKYGIVFDRGYDSFLIFDAYNVVYRGTVEEGKSIINADVDNKGNVVLSTKSNDSACRVYMFDKKGETKYIWSCAENYVVCMDISRDSEKIACAAIGARNNEIFTTVYMLDIFSDSAVSVYEVKDSACIDIMYHDSGKDKVILNCTDKRLVFDVSDDGSLGGHPSNIIFKGDCVAVDSDSDGNTAVITQRYNSPDSAELTLYNKDNNIVFSCDTLSGVVSALCSKDKVYCLTEKSILTYSQKSEKNAEFDCDIFGEGLVLLKGKIRYYSSKIIKNGF